MIYEYKCDSCDTETTIIRRVADRDLPARCACGLGNLVRVVSYPNGFILKGDGFYKPTKMKEEQ